MKQISKLKRNHLRQVSPHKKVNLPGHMQKGLFSSFKKGTQINNLTGSQKISFECRFSSQKMNSAKVNYSKLHFNTQILRSPIKPQTLVSHTAVRKIHTTTPVRGGDGKNHNYYPNMSGQKSAIELPLDNPAWLDNTSPPPTKPAWGPGSDSWIEFWNKHQGKGYLPVIVHAGQYWQGPNEVLTHQQRVTRLYRRCLRTVYNKIDIGFNADQADEVATDIRLRFRANMHVTDPKQIAALVYAGEDEADVNRVHLPYVPPYRGNEYHRNLPAPEPLTRMEARIMWPDDPGREDHTAFV